MKKSRGRKRKITDNAADSNNELQGTNSDNDGLQDFTDTPTKAKRTKTTKTDINSIKNEPSMTRSRKRMTKKEFVTITQNGKTSQAADGIEVETKVSITGIIIRKQVGITGIIKQVCT